MVRHWDEQFLKYTVAFERKLRDEIERCEPASRQWLLSVAWQFQHDIDCPYLEMPDPPPWAAPEAMDQEQADMQEDLARLFAVRDAHLAQPAAGSAEPATPDSAASPRKTRP